jgi:hypothetical protein
MVSSWIAMETRRACSLMASRAMAIRVQLYFLLCSPFTPSMTGVFHEVVIFVLIIVCFFKGSQVFNIGRHEERIAANSSCPDEFQTASKQMMSPSVYIHPVT